MEKTKVLFISQEITPYLPENKLSRVSRYLPQGIQERGKEIRTFMPRYGCINERRHQLHEVIRLSGMNLIIDDMDHPLIIKVASIQAARMQVYFIDNEDYFQRKHVLTNEEGTHFEDNDERAIFYARGVLETVKKLRWSPDVIHCQGWFTGIAPLYLKKVFNEDPLFADTKVVFSLYNDKFEESFSENFKEKVKLENISDEDVKSLSESNYYGINKLAIDHSDAVIIGSEEADNDLIEYAKGLNIPILEYKNEDEYLDAYSKFYDEVLGL